jgi:hypothetical protein
MSDRAEALHICEQTRPECHAPAIVQKFVLWLPKNPSANWRKALATFARGEHFNEPQHEAVKAEHRQADTAAVQAVLGGVAEREERTTEKARKLRAAGYDDATIAAHLRREGDPDANIASVRQLLGDPR